MAEINEDTIPFMELPKEDLDATNPNIAERLGLGDPDLMEIANAVQAKGLEMKRLIMKMRLEDHIKGKRYKLEDGSTVTVVRIKPMALKEAEIEVEDPAKGIRLIPESEFKGKLLEEQDQQKAA